MYVPHVVGFAVGLAISEEAGARLVQVTATVSALQTRGMPLEIWSYAHDELVGDAAPTPHARRQALAH